MPSVHPFILYVVQPHQLLEGMLFFLLIITGIIFFISFYGLGRSGRSAKRKRLRRQFSEFISHLAIADTEEECREMIAQPGNQKRLDGWLKDRFAREVLIRELYTTAKNMSGQATTNICWFYTNTGLHADSLAQLKNKKWHKKARAIQHLAHLQQQQYITKIYKLTNDKNELVRNEARIAVIKLTGFEGLRFLDIISFPLTEWQQISLLQELSESGANAKTSIARWLNSSNNSVVEFALRLVAHYQVYELHDAAATCLSSGDKTVREQAILALSEIAQHDTATILEQHFEAEEEKLQLLILRSLREFGTNQQIPFLLDCLSHPSDNVKAYAVKAIQQITGDTSLVSERVNIKIYPWTVLVPQVEQEVEV